MTRSRAFGDLQRLLRKIPSASPSSVARRLVARGNSARDARAWAMAAALYREAIAYDPGLARIRIQCGHMLKEMGDYAAAEECYLRAAVDLPNDADLPLQMGHLYKMAALPDKAAAAYRRALEILPNWREAERELASVTGLAERPQDGVVAPPGIVAQLLPRKNDEAPVVERNMLRLFHMGGRRRPSPWGELKSLSGVQAIRGYRLTDIDLAEIRLNIDGTMVQQVPLTPHASPAGAGAQRKYVFNLWHDFSRVKEGPRRIELDFIDPLGLRRFRHCETLLVEAAVSSCDAPQSDAVVDGAVGDLEAEINARPSMIRSTRRALLPKVDAILVQRVDQLGDLVCSVPAIVRLRELFPHARMIGLMTPANGALAEELRLFDEIVTVDFAEDLTERRRTMTAENQLALRRRLANYGFDLAVDLSQAADSRALLLLSGAKFLYGFNDRQSPWLNAGLEFNAHDAANDAEVLPPSRKMLLLIEGLSLLAAGHTSRPTPFPPKQISPSLVPSRPYVVLHTGARLPYTRWPGFSALAKLILAQTDLDVVYFTDDSSIPSEMAEPIAQGRVRLAGLIPFDQFDALLAGCAVFVGNDSGPKHLAALRGVPVVSLHMARLNWSEWGQEGSGRIVSRRVPCAGCGIGLDAEDCGRHFVCLRNIKAAEVFAAMQDCLQESGGLP